MIRLFFLILIQTLFFNNSFGTETVNHIQYTIEYDSLDDIARRYINLFPKKYHGDIQAFKRDLVIWNTHIRNWKNLTHVRPIYIESPDEQERKFNALTRDWSLHLFYSASLGKFAETTADQTIATWQNSPVSLGLSTYYNVKDRKHSVVSSIYISKLEASKAKGDISNSGQNLKIPNELGMNLYYQYNYKYSYPTFYTGFDRETFASFNTKDLSQGEALQLRKNVLYFLTIGAAKSFYIFKSTITVRASLAKDLISKSNSNNPNDTFSGTRILLYLSLKGQHDLSYNLLYKRFSLKGPTKLEVNRLGLGIGW